MLIAGRREDAPILDSVLHAAAFQPLSIPESFDDNPNALRAELKARREQLNHECEVLRGQLANWLSSSNPSPTGDSTEGFLLPSQYIRSTILRRYIGSSWAMVNQIWRIQPAPLIAAMVTVSPAPI